MNKERNIFVRKNIKRDGSVISYFFILCMGPAFTGGEVGNEVFTRIGVVTTPPPHNTLTNRCTVHCSCSKTTRVFIETLYKF